MAKKDFYSGGIKPPKIPELEQYVVQIYKQNPEAVQKKQELLNALDNDLFDNDEFRTLVNEWNDTEKNKKGFEGQVGKIERLNGEHGKLEVYYFHDSDSIKFGYDIRDK